MPRMSQLITAVAGGRGQGGQRRVTAHGAGGAEGRCGARGDRTEGRGSGTGSHPAGGQPGPRRCRRRWTLAISPLSRSNRPSSRGSPGPPLPQHHPGPSPHPLLPQWVPSAPPGDPQPHLGQELAVGQLQAGLRSRHGGGHGTESLQRRPGGGLPALPPPRSASPPIKLMGVFRTHRTGPNQRPWGDDSRTPTWTTLMGTPGLRSAVSPLPPLPAVPWGPRPRGPPRGDPAVPPTQRGHRRKGGPGGGVRVGWGFVCFLRRTMSRV